MKKSTFSKTLYWTVCQLEQLLQMKSFCKLFFCLAFFSLSFNGHAQVGTKFSARLVDADGNKYLKVQGDIKIIGNSILVPKGKTLPYDGGEDNNELEAVYVDVDGDGATTSSSSSNLLINNSCKKIIFAGLYWSAMYPNGSSTDKNCFNCGTAPLDDWNEVKFKVPGGAYTTIIANKTNPKEVIFKGANTNDFNNGVYVCFKDVTSIVAPLANADGTYTVGNVRATTGFRRGGSAGGWSLVIIYESPTVTSKYISVFDGAQMTNVDAGSNQLLTVDIPISGFQTLPSPFPVNAKIGVAALDGDYNKKGDGLLFVNGIVPTTTPNSSFTPISNSSNPLPNNTATPPAPDFPKSNFFNASITVDNANVLTRNPYSTNNLGFDIDYLAIPNPSNGVIPNGATSGTYRMFTDTAGGDGYAAFLTTFAVDIIEPKILLTKEVYDNSSPQKNMGDKNVSLSQQLNYVIGFQNQGNDNVTAFTIKDVLPINIKFNYPADITSLPPPIVIGGVTYKVTHTYNAATRTILFTIPNVFVEVNDPRYEIRLGVKVVDSCNELSDACSNIIKNVALSSYSGTYNTAPFGDESLASYTNCNVGIPQATNFLVGVDGCKFTKSEVLCGNSVDIKASSGYSTYKWSTAPFTNTGTTTGTILGTNQILTVTNPGIYYVYNTAIAPCLSITEAVTVSRSGTITTNPLIAIADKVVTCVSGGAGKQLPYFFLCGANATRLLTTSISDGSTIVWEKLNEASCTAVTDPYCANESTACTWSTVGSGASYTANASGQFRITLNYPGGCFNRFYFNVYKNTLDPTETHSDIICTTKGNITIGGIPLTDYEYSISSVNGNTPSIPYQNSNSFTINTGGLYTVYIKQKGVTINACIFEIKNISIRQRNFTVDQFVTHPICFNDKGTIKVAANDVRGPYTYEIFKNGVSVDKLQNTANADYTFTGLVPGAYSYTVTTADGCSYTQYYVAIADAAGEIKATPSIKVPLTDCTKGIIKIETQQDRNYGNTFYYFVDGSPTFQTSNEIEVTTSGEHTIRIVGLNNCETVVKQQVNLLPKPTFAVTNTNTNCYDEKAKINIALNGSSAGYKVEYSIDNGVTYVEGNATGIEFPNLYAGQYKVLVRFSVTYPITNWPGTETVICPLAPVQTITINGPTSAVTASAGVGELAGCGPLDGSGKPTGLLRITNVQGGTSPYTYSFDGGNYWENVTQKYVVAGTYSLAVKDALGCIFKIPYTVTVDDKPADPDISNKPDILFNCDGSATATVVVSTPTTSGGTYTYEYYLQKNGTGAIVPNTPISSNVFTNVPIGDHKIIVKYIVNTVSSYSNLLQEDFGKGGFTTTPGINPAYCFEDESTTHLDPSYKCNKDEWINDGEYAVASKIRTVFSTWMVANDHTLPDDPLGRFLCVNVGGTAGIGGILYSKPIKDVIPNQPVIISLWAENLIKSIHPSLHDPKLTIELINNLNGVGGPETIVASSDPSPGHTNPWQIPKSDKWEYKELSLNPGTYNNLSFVIRSYSNEFNGNDVLIDDIWVRQIPRTCGNTKEVSVKIDAGNAFKATQTAFSNIKCFGETNGTITFKVENFNAATGYEYNVDGGLFKPASDQELVINSLGVGKHTIIIRNNASGTCSFTLEQTISQPTAVTVTASITKQPTCTTGATITAVGGGGSLSGYWYELRNTVGGAVVRPFQNNAQFTDVPVGNYTVFARDSNSCLSAGSLPVDVVGAAAVTATLAASSDLCYDTVNQAKLVVTAAGSGTLTYKLDTNQPQSSNTFTNVGPGTHTIVVTDSNNCTATISGIIIAPELKFNVSLIQDLTCLNPASIGNPVITDGNGAPYTYTVSYNSGSPSAVASFPYSATQAGSYVFTVKDSKSCTASSIAISVTAKTKPTIVVGKTDITCNNKNDGTITVTAANGFTAVYTYAYKLNTAATYTTQTTNQITGLAAGIYNIKVIDSKGCESDVTDVTIVNPTAVAGTISATELGCSGTGTVDAVVTVNGSGGVGPYEYSFNGNTNFKTNNKFSTSTPGEVQAYVKDKNGCEFGPLKVTIAPKVLITGIDVMFETGLECPAYEAHVKFQAIGGLSPIKYKIVSGPSGFSTGEVSDGEFKNLKPGDYVFRATDKNGCSFDLNYNVKSVPDITAGGSVLTPIKCFGDKGTIQFTVSGVKDRGYDYVIKNAANAVIQSANNVSETITTINVTASQPAGAYTITVTDRKTSCPATYTVNLTQPAAALSITSAAGTNVNCKNDNSNITIAATGGTTNYSYAYAKSPSTVPTSAYVSGAVLTVDTNSGADLVWDVYVKDANDCTAKRTVTVISDPIPSVTAVVSNQCTASGSNFTITATGTGGIGTLTYGINGAGGAFQPGNTFNVPASATPYTVWVKDANQCTASAAAVTVYAQLTSNAVVTKVLDCSASPNAVITTTITGGKAPYTYTVQKGAGAPISGGAASASLTFTTSVSNANADTYKFVITDANGCPSTATAIVNPITNPTVSETHLNPLCNGNSNGSVQLTGAGGSGGYTYSKDNVTFVSSGSFTGLAAGTYTFYVKDSKGCTGTVDATLINPVTVGASAVVTTAFKCSITNTKEAAVITVTGSGGSGTYTYSFDNGFSFSPSSTKTVNDNGSTQSFDIFVKDSNGCISSVNHIDLAPLNPPAISSITGTPIYCLPAASTTSTVTVTRTAGTGVGTLTYAITAPAAAVTSNSTGVFNGLIGGTAYTFKVTDANGCFAVQSYTVPTVTPIAAAATKLTDVDCRGNNTGSIRYNVSGFSGTYSYTINGGTAVTGQTAATFTLPSLVAGPYNVVFTDAVTGCTFPTAITITQPATDLSATAAKVNANCITTTSKVTINATGGTPTYTYAYKQDNAAPVAADYIASNTADLNPATNANWDVWVKDANGCTFKLDVAVASDLIPSVTASVLNQCGASGSTFQIKAVGAAGVAPYTYTINTGVAPSPADTFTVAAGTYTITVKDANGCTNTTSVTVYDVLDADAIKKKDLTCSVPADAQIDVTITGGKPNFSYKVKFNGGAYGTSTAVVGNTFTTNPSAAGTYQFEITDANGCKKETNVITVNPIVNPVITGITQTQDIKCNGDSTGRIVVTVPTTGEGPYQYSIDGGLYQSSNIFSDLIAGSHTVTVKDSKGCVNLVPYAFSIAQPNPIAFSLGIVNIQCTGAGNSLGSITVKNVSGGTAPFKYFISNNFGSVIVPNPYVAASNVDFTFTIIDFGIYTINVVDANGCSLSKQITMSSPPGDLLIDVTTIAADCTNGGSAKVTVTAPVLGSNYEFGILTSNTVPYASTFYPANSGLYSYIFDHLTSGVTYSFVVHDITTNCYYVNTASSPIAPVSSLKSVVTANNISCKGSMDGSVTFTVSSFDTSTTSIDYQLFASQSNAPISAVLTQTVSSGVSFTKTYPVPGTLPVGTYYIVFTEHGGVNNGCKSASEDFDIKESAIALSVNASVAKNENCDNLGIITALAKDGTAPYLYMITGSAVAPSATDPAWNSTSTFTRAAGTYYVHAKDAYNCIQPSAVVNLIKDPIPVIALSVVNKCVAEGAFGISVARTTAGIGTHSISVDNSTFTSVGAWPHTVTGLNSGSHTIVVKDANGCIDTKLITIDKPLVATPAITTLPTCADNDGVITMSGTGGPVAGTYTFSISPSPATAVINNLTGVISGLPAGTYTVTMTDTAVPANCTTTASVTLTAPTPVTFTTTTTKVLCSGDSNGSITVNLNAGNNNPSYTYEITAGPVTRPVQPSNVFNSLPAGSYTVKVNSGRGCSDIKNNVIVGTPTPLAATSSITTALTCGTGNVAQPATVTVVGTPGTGTAPYEYSFDNGANYSSTNIYQSYVGIKFDVKVKDANGCIFILTDGVDIPALAAPTDLTFNTTVPVTCLVNGTVEITGHTGGVGTLQYEILSPIIRAKQPGTTFANLAPGTYVFQVTDANGCSYQESHTVAPVTNITVSGQLISNVSCNPGSNGEVLFTVNNFAGTYTYSINGGTVSAPQNNPTITVSGLSAASTQIINITDVVTGCTATASVAVSIPASLTLSEVVSDRVNANCGSGAKVTVLASGGTPNYTYAFVANNAVPLASDYTSSASAVLPFTAPAPNNWDVWVKDNNGCTFKLDITTNVDPLPSIVLPDAQCFTGTPLTIDLSLPAVTTVPVGPVRYYTINGSNQTSPIYTITAPGTYKLSVVDANGCPSNIVDYVVRPQLVLDSQLTQDLTCVSNAVITLAASGGTGTYNAFEVSIDGAAFVPASNPYSAAVDGSYVFRVTDNQVPSCPAISNPVVVTPKTTPAFTAVSTLVSCNGGSDGTITVTASNGILPYKYSINGGVFQTSNVFTGLALGTYSIVVQDAKECPSAAQLIDVTQPAVLNASVSVKPFGCSAANTPEDAVVTIAVTGGTAPYTYSFDGGTTFQDSDAFPVNTAQTINYVVLDAKGCSFNGTANVLPYTPPTDMDITVSPIYCNTPGTVATLTVNSVIGGVSPYTYEIISPAVAVTSNTTGSFANLAPDTYVIKVTDSNGCSTTNTVEIKEASKITATAQLVNDVYCKDGNSGSVSFTVANYITAGSYTFNLTPPTGSFTQSGDVITYTGLTAGNYTFTVIDLVSGCIGTVVDFTVSQPALALSSASIATNINCGNDNATITVTAIGGTADYKYAVARAGDPVPVLTSYGTSEKLVVDTNNGADVNWIVYVMDSNGCSATNAQAISLDANPVIATAIAAQCPSAAGTYAITVTASGFSAALQYSADGTNYQTGNVITVNIHGTYNITVKDANGCISAPVSVTILEPLTLNAVVAAAPSCLDNDGVVNLVAAGGSGSYQYNIDGGAFVAGNSFTDVTFGSHTMGVRDTATPCEFYVPINLTRATRVTGFNLSMTTVTCNGGSDGTITAVMAAPAPGINDNPVYMYSLNGGTPQESNIFTGLTAGSYTVDVISGRGCPATKTITVTQPDIIVVPAPTVVQFECTAGSNSNNFATITVNNVTGGSRTYSIYEFVKGITVVQRGVSNSYTESDAAGGSYTVNVYDDKGCIGSTTAPIVINAFISLEDININITQAITCKVNQNITVTAVTAGGTPLAGTLEYTVVGINGTVYSSVTNTVGTFSNLGIGEYSVSVKNTTTNCIKEIYHIVNDPNTFELKAVKISDVICHNSNEGSVELAIFDVYPLPTNEAGAFDYVITSSVLGSAINGSSTTAGPVPISGLKAGLYNVTATLKNRPECSVSTVFIIDQPSAPLTISETHTEITCAAANNDGTITASAAGGWAGDYQYELVGPVSTPYGPEFTFTKLTAGSYTVNVKDSHGCVASTPVVLSNPAPIVVNAASSVSMLSCNGDKSAVITASVELPGGGQGSNYLYTLNYTSLTPVVSSGPQSSGQFTGLGAGKYTVTVTDGWGCSRTSVEITISEPTKVEASLIKATLQTCLIPATLTLTAAGGTGTYTYSDDPSFVSPITMIGNTATFSVGNGTFRYYVRDANGCVSIVSNDIQNDPLEPLGIDLDIRNAVINCQGDLTGFVFAVAKGGLGNYVYSLVDASGNAIAVGAQDTSGTFTELPAGTYYIKVVSGDCEFTSAPVVITEPATALTATYTTVDVTCNGNNDGKIIVNAAGGTGIIKYAISPDMNQFFDISTFSNLKPGLYEVLVQDQNGCFILFKDIEIKEPNPIASAVVAGSEVQEYCAGDKTGAFSITISGGVGPYSTSIDDPNGTYVLGQVDFSGLSGGDHTVYIKDANTCTFELLVQLDPAVILDPVAVTSYDCVNDLPANKVTVSIDPSNNPADVTYSLDNTGVEQASNVFTNLVPGDHFIMVHHKNSCVDATLVFHIDQIDPLNMTLDLGKLNEIVATATGGSGVYQYSVNGESLGSNNKYIYFHSGNYTFTVTDTNGCVFTVTKYFEFVDIEIPNVFTPNGNGPNTTWKPLKTENYPDIKFVVYDRYGREVGHFGAGESWDGKYKGTELPMGDYWYVLKLRHTKDEREFIGHFTLYR